MRILQRLKEYDGSITVNELIEQIENEQTLKDIKRQQEAERVKNNFEGVYLKRFIQCPMFGRTLKVYHIKKIGDNELTTDWELIYHVEGNKISFSKRDITYRKLSSDSSLDTFSEQDLNEMTKITGEEYNLYMNQYQQIESKLEKLIR